MGCGRMHSTDTSSRADSLTFVTDKGEKLRLDVAIQRAAAATSLPLTRSQASKLIQSGQVTVDAGVVRRPGSVVKPGSTIVVQYAEPVSELVPYDFPLDILHVDSSFLVINKPAQLTMHPGAGNRTRTLANAVANYLQDPPDMFASGVRPGIVHRLDRDTTGVVVVARTAAAHAHLSAQFANRTIERTYTALVAVTPRANREVQRTDRGTIETQLNRHPAQRMRQAVVAAGGRRACTHWQRLEIMYYAALLQLRLETGRTHQIRVHMDHIRSPVVGDKTYGQVDFYPAELERKVKEFGRQALHAATLAFDHPETGARLSFSTPVPEDLQVLIEVFRNCTDG